MKTRATTGDWIWVYRQHPEPDKLVLADIGLTWCFARYTIQSTWVDDLGNSIQTPRRWTDIFYKESNLKKLTSFIEWFDGQERYIEESEDSNGPNIP